jgi:hypothetical protein
LLPALLTRKSKRVAPSFPSAYLVLSTKASNDADVTRIQLQRNGIRPRILHFSNDCLRVRTVAVIGKYRVDSVPREALDGIAANAAACSS